MNIESLANDVAAKRKATDAAEVLNTATGGIAYPRSLAHAERLAETALKDALVERIAELEKALKCEECGGTGFSAGHNVPGPCKACTPTRASIGEKKS